MDRGRWEQLVAGVEATCRILIQVARRVVKREAMEGRLESATPWIRRCEGRLMYLIRSISEIYYVSVDTTNSHTQKYVHSGCLQGSNPP